MNSNVLWGSVLIVFGSTIVALIDFFVKHDVSGWEVPIIKAVYGGVFIVVGVALILLKDREKKIEKIREDKK